jgi:hypothetical protein
MCRGIGVIAARARVGRLWVRRVQAAAAAAALAGGLLLATGVVWAASVGLSADPSGPLPLESLVEPPAPAPVGQVLSRALSADGSTRLNNLDLLLELHGSVPAGRGASAAVSPGGGSIKVSPAPVVGSAELARQASALSRSTLLTGDGGLPLPAADLLARPQRDWRVGGPSDGSGGGVESAGDAGSRGAGYPAAGDDGLVRELVTPLAQFARSYREWLLGGLALLFVLGAAFKALSRRI